MSISWGVRIATQMYETSRNLLAKQESTLLEKGLSHPQACLGVCHEVSRAVQ
jgi:hypothetical protein